MHGQVGAGERKMQGAAPSVWLLPVFACVCPKHGMWFQRGGFRVVREVEDSAHRVHGIALNLLQLCKNALDAGYDPRGIRGSQHWPPRQVAYNDLLRRGLQQRLQAWQKAADNRRSQTCRASGYSPIPILTTQCGYLTKK